MERAKVLEKIQKALNLAKDRAATPGEAAAALNSAQKLMAKYGVDESELGLVGYASELIETTTQATANSRSVPMHINAISALIMRAFGVRALFSKRIAQTDIAWNVQYHGKADRVALAAYSHVVINRTIERAWAEKIKRNPSMKGVRGGRYSFYLGFLVSVEEQVTAVAMTDEEKAELEKYILREVGEPGKPKKREMDINGRAARAGISAAADFKLHKPMGGNEAERLRLGN